MNVSAVSPDLSQRSAELNSLQSALQSGNITNAQHAFAAFEQEIHKASVAGATKLFAPGSQTNKDLQMLGSALKSADLAGAQHAFLSLKQDIQATAPITHNQPAQTLTKTGHVANGAGGMGSILNLRG